jgi:hypothetical protein
MTPSRALPIGHADTKLVSKNKKSPPLTPVSLDARDLIQILARYRAPSCMRSIVELVITAGPLILLWLLMWATLDLGYWLCLLLAVPAAGFLVRLFMIQHDCGHGAFFHRRFANDWVGRVIGVLTLTPRFLATRSRCSPRHVRQSRAPRNRRRRHADCAGVPRAVPVGSAALPRLPAPGRHVRHGPGLFVPRTAPAASRPDAQWLAALAQHRLDKPRYRGCYRHDDMARRHRSVPTCASANHATGGLGRGLVVLCSAPI